MYGGGDDAVTHSRAHGVLAREETVGQPQQIGEEVAGDVDHGTTVLVPRPG